MAISPAAKYPGQVDTSDPSAYPYGAAKNNAVPGDGSGFPFEKAWVNDLLGFEQSLLDAAGITPSGTPDEVGASDYYDALLDIIDAHDFAQTVDFDNGIRVNSGGITVAANGISIGGGGLSVVGGIVCHQTLTVNGNTTLGNAALDQTVITGSLGLTGSAIFTGGLAIGTDLGVGDDLTVAGLATLADLTVNGTATFLGGMAIGGVLAGGVFAYTGAGHARERFVLGADAATDYGIEDADVIYVQSLSAPRVYTLLADGAASGDKITIITNDTTNAVTVAGISGPSQVLRNASGQTRMMEFRYLNGTGWIKGLRHDIP